MRDAISTLAYDRMERMHDEAAQRRLASPGRGRRRRCAPLSLDRVIAQLARWTGRAAAPPPRAPGRSHTIPRLEDPS